MVHGKLLLTVRIHHFYRSVIRP